MKTAANDVYDECMRDQSAVTRAHADFEAGLQVFYNSNVRRAPVVYAHVHALYVVLLRKIATYNDCADRYERMVQPV